MTSCASSGQAIQVSSTSPCAAYPDACQSGQAFGVQRRKPGLAGLRKMFTLADQATLRACARWTF